MKKHLIITAANGNVARFLTDEWLRSLEETSDLSDIDVVVLDYGLGKIAVSKLTKHGVRVVSCSADGHVVNLRLRDSWKYLYDHTKAYDQVLYIDGGDIIFQTDVHAVFRTNPADIRIASQYMSVDILNLLTFGSYTPGNYRKIILYLLGKPVLNGGVIAGPIAEMAAMMKESYDLITDRSQFMPDQTSINYVLYRRGFTKLDPGFNFMKLFTHRKTVISDGYIRYSPSGVLVPIVHNNGWKPFFRPFRNFGYGPGHNTPNQPIYAYTELRMAVIGLLSTLFPRLRPNS